MNNMQTNSEQSEDSVAVRSGDLLDRFALECAKACHEDLGAELNAERIKPVLRSFIGHLAKFAEDSVLYNPHSSREWGERASAICIRDRLLNEANANRSNDKDQATASAELR
jgi:hypothetical protein